MGHRFQALSLPPHLTAWHEAGLELVYADLLGAGATAAEAVDAAGAADAEIGGNITVTPCQPAASGPKASLEPRAEPTDTIPGIVPAAPDAAIGAATGAATVGRVASVVPPRPWTGPFEVAMERLRKPVRVVWTYWELALDFGNEPDNARRALCASILKHLPWKNLLGFWPLSERKDSIILARPEQFWRGMAELGASHVLCFGRRASMTLFPDRPFEHGVIHDNQITAVILPGFEEMLPDNRQAKAAAWGLLKNLHIPASG